MHIMKMKQSFKEETKPKDIDPEILEQYFCELYQDPSYLANDVA